MCHDYMHCAGVNCKLKDTCFRYHLHLDALNNKLKTKWFSYKADSKVDEECVSYWKVKE